MIARSPRHPDRAASAASRDLRREDGTLAARLVMGTGAILAYRNTGRGLVMIGRFPDSRAAFAALAGASRPFFRVARG